ncbi:hypothetical protein QLR68_10600, partial [Micromonospora sp. DH15]|nr:hypothetical protein [Micromonospora sp. DH15]
MVHELAAYERAADECHLTAGQLTEALFGPAPALFGHVAVDGADRPLGFALWFLNFSTWAGVHGIYLEDLYVRPEARGTGAAAAERPAERPEGGRAAEGERGHQQRRRQVGGGGGEVGPDEP